MTISKDVNLDASFEKLKEKLFEAVKKAEGNINLYPERKALAFGLLESAVKIHLSECTDKSFGDIQRELDAELYPTLDMYREQPENDIPFELFHTPGLGNYLAD